MMVTWALDSLRGKRRDCPRLSKSLTAEVASFHFPRISSIDILRPAVHLEYSMEPKRCIDATSFF